MSNHTKLSGKIQTVTGLIDPEELGSTLMHEHLIVDLNPLSQRAKPLPPDDIITLENSFKIRYGQLSSANNFRLDEPDVAIAELKELKAAGGNSLVELTIGGIGPEPETLARISRESGINIVMGCGHYVHGYHFPENKDRSVDSFASEMIAAIREGAWGTNIRAGIIGEIGCEEPWDAAERRVLEGAVLAQMETGASLNVHPGRHPDQPKKVADFVRSTGGIVERLIVSHIERTIFDEERLLRLADTGAVLEFDLFGWEQSAYGPADIDMPNDNLRVKWIKVLLDRGYGDQLVISHDIFSKTRLLRYGGHGYQHIYANILPFMRRRGISDEQIRSMMVDTPRRLLTFK